jgi:hypothetical protein
VETGALDDFVGAGEAATVDELPTLVEGKPM